MAGQNYRVIITDEGRRTLHYFNTDECLYWCNKTVGAVKYLECREPGCRARAKITDGGLLERTGDVQHSHTTNHRVQAEYETAFQQLRELAKVRSNSKLRDLHREVIRDISVEAASYLNWENCRATLQRIRNRDRPKCRNLQELQAYLEDEESPVFKEFGCFQGDTEDRLYAGTVNGQLIFANFRLIEQLPDLVDLFIDGTFGVVPFHTRQLLVIMAELQGQPRPILYAVMQSQTTEDYASIFRFFSEVLLGEERIVMSVTSDFEQSIRAAVRSVWAAAVITGCNFHFCQAVEKNASQTAGLSGAKLETGSTYRKCLLMFMRLSLLPLNCLTAGYNALLGHLHTLEAEVDDFDASDFDEFIDYFDRVWLNRFAPETWCVSDRDRRTNNNVEGHNRWIKEVIDNNPSPWEFLEGIRDLMVAANAKFTRDRRTNAVTPQSLSRLSEPLEEALGRLNNKEIDELEFLKIMAAS